MNVEEEILKLYMLINTNFKKLNEISEQVNLLVIAQNKTLPALTESITTTGNTSTQILAKVQVLQEEVLSLKKSSPD